MKPILYTGIDIYSNEVIKGTLIAKKYISKTNILEHPYGDNRFVIELFEVHESTVKLYNVEAQSINEPDYKIFDYNDIKTSIKRIFISEDEYMISVEDLNEPLKLTVFYKNSLGNLIKIEHNDVLIRKDNQKCYTHITIKRDGKNVN